MYIKATTNRVHIYSIWRKTIQPYTNETIICKSRHYNKIDDTPTIHRQYNDTLLRELHTKISKLIKNRKICLKIDVFTLIFSIFV